MQEHIQHIRDNEEGNGHCFKPDKVKEIGHFKAEVQNEALYVKESKEVIHVLCDILVDSELLWIFYVEDIFNL